ATDVRLQKLRMRREVIERRLLVLRQPEEVVLLANPLRLERRMERTVAVDEILLLLELLAADAVPAFVDAFVDVAALIDPAGNLGGARLVSRLRGADEIVERHVQPGPCAPEHLLHLIAVGERIEPFLLRLLEHVLRMVVVPHQEPRVEPAEALVARDHVGAHLLVGRAEVRLAVDVVDGGGEEIGLHARAPYAAIAIACTSFTDSPFSRANAAQSSNSGVALTMRPLWRASLKRTGPIGVSMVTISRSRHSRSTS